MVCFEKTQNASRRSSGKWKGQNVKAGILIHEKTNKTQVEWGGIRKFNQDCCDVILLDFR